MTPWGQWLGRIDGTNQGTIIFNVDEDRRGVGRLLVCDDDPAKLCFAARATLTHHDDRKLSGKLDQIHVFRGGFYQKDAPAEAPQAGDFTAEASEAGFRGEWNTSLGTKGSFEAPRVENLPAMAGESTTWEGFRDRFLAEKKRNPGLIFRGLRSNAYSLRSSFHRSGRRDLVRFDLEDWPQLAYFVGMHLGKSFRYSSREHYGQLLNLAQHHGYPTPLIDWTNSPFVAAFFAFERAFVDRKPGQKVRIMVFDTMAWGPSSDQCISSPIPTFGCLQLSARDNPRALPQQSVHTFSNVADAGVAIALVEKGLKKTLLSSFDLDASDAPSAMADLRLMNVTAASLFPGLDGVMSALRHEHFLLTGEM